MPTIKNIIIFTAIAIAFILVYIFFIKPSPEPDSLVSSGGVNSLPNIEDGFTVNPSASNTSSLITQDFLILLSNVKNIKLDDTIFSSPAFISLRDSSITLIPDGNEGRPNPFAQFGNDAVTPAQPSSFTPLAPTTSAPAKP